MTIKRKSADTSGGPHQRQDDEDDLSPFLDDGLTAHPTHQILMRGTEIVTQPSDQRQFLPTLRYIPELTFLIGEKETLLLLQLEYLIRIADPRNHIDGYKWTYQSAESLRSYFPVWSETTVYRTCRSLAKQGLIRIGCFNKRRYDRTRWYTLTEKGADLLYTVLRPRHKDYKEPLHIGWRLIVLIAEPIHVQLPKRQIGESKRQIEVSNLQNDESLPQNDESVRQIGGPIPENPHKNPSQSQVEIGQRPPAPSLVKVTPALEIYMKATRISANKVPPVVATWLAEIEADSTYDPEQLYRAVLEADRQNSVFKVPVLQSLYWGDEEAESDEEERYYINWCLEQLERGIPRHELRWRYIEAHRGVEDSEE